jgi:hypothetical protein
MTKTLLSDQDWRRFTGAQTPVFGAGGVSASTASGEVAAGVERSGEDTR